MRIVIDDDRTKEVLDNINEVAGVIMQDGWITYNFIGDPARHRIQVKNTHLRVFVMPDVPDHSGQDVK